MKNSQRNYVKGQWREKIESNIIELNEANMVGKLGMASHRNNQYTSESLSPKKIELKKRELRDFFSEKAIVIPKISLMARFLSKEKDQPPNKFYKKVALSESSNRSHHSESLEESNNFQLDKEAPTLAFYDDIIPSPKLTESETLMKQISFPSSVRNRESLPALKKAAIKTIQFSMDSPNGSFMQANNNKRKSHVSSSHKRASSFGVSVSNLANTEMDQAEKPESKIQRIKFLGLGSVQSSHLSPSRKIESKSPKGSPNSKRLLQERIGISKLFIDMSQVKTARVPLQFYITSKELKTPKEELKDFISEDSSPPLSPHLKSSYQTPRIVPVVKKPKKLFQTSLLQLEAILNKRENEAPIQSPVAAINTKHRKTLSVFVDKKYSSTPLELSVL